MGEHRQNPLTPGSKLFIRKGNVELLKRLLWGKDPTSEWVRDMATRIECDLSTHSLCGVAIKEPFVRLSALGPSEDRKRAGNGDFCYFSRGLKVGTKNGMITDFSFMWDSLLQVKNLIPFNGRFTFEGNVTTLGTATHLDTFISIFGEPYWKDEDDYGIALFYEYGDIEWQLDFNEKKCLYWFVITTPPLFEDEKNRQSYKLTKPWPPQ